MDRQARRGGEAEGHGAGDAFARLEAMAARTFPAAAGTRAAAFARQAAMYLAHVALGRNFTQIGRRAGRHRTTVAYACGRIEEAREDPAVDAALAALERGLAGMRGSAR